MTEPPIKFDISQLPKAEVFSNKVNTLEQQLPAILDDYKKYYVFYNKNPEFEEYQQSFEKIKTNLKTTYADLFSITNGVKVNTNDINDKLAALNILILKERQKNRRLKILLGYAEKKNNGADEMVSDYKEMYELEYLRNWGLFLGVVITSLALGSFFKGQNSQTNPTM